MALRNILMRMSSAAQTSSYRYSACVRWTRNYSVHEPPDLKLEPDIPEYPSLNVCMKSYDFAVLEGFMKYAHRLFGSFGLDTTVFPVPARTSHLTINKYGTNVVLHEHDLALYERVIQVENLPSTYAPILFEILQLNTPEGVKFTVKEPTDEEEEFRYVPDLEVQELQSQLAEIEKVREERRKK